VGITMMNITLPFAILGFRIVASSTSTLRRNFGAWNNKIFIKHNK
jgi:hypothetical protein